MAKVCLLTGVPENESPIKKMCVNCVFSQYNQNEENYTCNNQKVMEIGFEKVKDAAKNLGYDIDTLSLKPMVLKNPLKLCVNYKPDSEVINDFIKSLFGNVSQLQSSLNKDV